MRVVGLALILAACGRISFDPLDDVVAPDAAAPCQQWSPFAPPALLAAPIQSAVDEWVPTPTRGGLELYFYSYRSGDGDLWRATRPDLASDFSAAIRVDELATTDDERTASLTDDALDIVFEREIGTTSHLYEATRASTAVPFGSATAIAALNSATSDVNPFVTPDGLRVVFASLRIGAQGFDLYEATRSTRASPWSAPIRLDSLVTSMDEHPGSLSADGLQIYFVSNRAGGPGAYDVYTARRPALDQPFVPPQLVAELSSSSDETGVRLSIDGSTMYMVYATPLTGGTADLWSATRTCL